MADMAFLGPAIGKVGEGISRGMLQGQLYRMMLDRQDRRDALAERRLDQQAELQREQIAATKETRQASAANSFVEGAVKFYKATGNAEATKNFWNQNASRYGLMQIDQFQPIDQDQLQVHFENGTGVVVNKTKGTVSPLTTTGGQAYQAPRTLKDQAEDFAAQTKLDMMTGGEVDPNVAAAAGVKLPTEKTAKTMTPMQAMKRKTDLLTSRVKLLKGNEMDALLASLNPNYQPGASIDDKTKQAVDAQIETEIAELDKIISSGGNAVQPGGSRTTTIAPATTIKSTSLDQNQIGKVNGLLKGKPANVYTFDGGKIVVKWDGQRVIP